VWIHPFVEIVASGLRHVSGQALSMHAGINLQPKRTFNPLQLPSRTIQRSSHEAHNYTQINKKN
jgi:hypothetical protein